MTPTEDWKDKLADLIDAEALECAKTNEPTCHVNEIIYFVSQTLREQKENEVRAWLKGERCHMCGKEIKSSPLSDICGDCYETN